MDRPHIVAGRFYPGTRSAWESEVRGYLDSGSIQREQALLAMVPHAGYSYSGAIAGKTLSSVSLPETVLLLGPNHTGMGASFAVWPSGRWLLPGAHLDVDTQLAQSILDSIPATTADYQAHYQEHSLEVILPFLFVLKPDIRIVPLAVSAPKLDNLLAIGQDLADVLSQWPAPVMIVVSSDMSHFISAEQAKLKDNLALNAILELDPAKFYSTVRSGNISMCGVLPMTIGMAMVNSMGGSKAKIIAYGTSGDVSGEFSQVVGYAGVVIT
ncbi:AmmeMemoRadiSam system protein B [Desulfonatronum parangueonense]